MALTNRLLRLLLIVSMATFLVARPAMSMNSEVTAVEICHEGRLETVYLDANGQAWPGKPLCDCAGCSHCALISAAVLPVLPETHAASGGSRAIAPVSHEAALLPRPARAGLARAPPLVKG